MLHPTFRSLRRPLTSCSATTIFTGSRAPLSLRMASNLPRLPIFEAIAKHDPKSTVAIHSVSGRRFTYGGLLGDVVKAKEKLQSESGVTTPGQRVAFLVENSYDYVVTLLSCFANESIALPLSPSFPASELQYILKNSEAAALLSSEKFRSKADEVAKGVNKGGPTVTFLEKILDNTIQCPDVKLVDGGGEGGMMLYTSGTTNRPKGVLLPIAALTAQALSLAKAWKYSPNDHLLHVLPLHHIHGTINALLTPLFAGSTIEFMFPFNANAVWERFAAPFLSDINSSGEKKAPITFFTVVPTIYNRLLNTHAQLSSEIQIASKEAILPKNLRINISGSAALPTPIKSAWTELSGGNVLLERYGMTEVGMALSCGLEYTDRVDGSVGWPLPGVEARLVDESGKVIAIDDETSADGKERSGEIQLRGPTIFKEYWKNEKATSSEFVEAEDGKGKWFKTGDVAHRKTVEGAGKSSQDWAKGPMYFISGRSSTDIIKTGGEKVSALEVERELLSQRPVSEAAVVGIKSEQWGQKVAAVVVLRPEFVQDGKGWSVMDMRRALKNQLVNYKIPQELKIVDSIPKNAMGKINKKELVTAIFGEQA